MTFLDTNVLVYTAGLANPGKRDQAISLVKAALQNPSQYAISVQTLSEFTNVALRKLKMAPDAISGYLQYFSALNTVQPDTRLVQRGLEIKAFYGIQYYDALIVAAAERAQAKIILTEDLSDGQYYCGMMARNPFVGK